MLAAEGALSPFVGRCWTCCIIFREAFRGAKRIVAVLGKGEELLRLWWSGLWRDEVEVQPWGSEDV